MRYFSSTTDSICSTIKRGSATNSKRTSNRSIHPATLYDYVLRSAILAWIEQSRSTKKRNSFHHLLESVKREKIPRDLTKGLCRRLEPMIDLPAVRHQTRQINKELVENRHKTMDDLVDLFLRADQSVQDNPFRDILLQTLQEEGLATPELVEKLNPEDERRKKKRTSVLLGSSCLLEEFPIVVHLQELFNIQEDEHKRKLNELVMLCTERALFHDLKNCINSVHSNQSFLGKREDFRTDEAFDQWQKTEIKQLTEKMNTIIYLNPKLSLPSPTEETEIRKIDLVRRSRTASVSSVSSISSRIDDQFESFVFIPPDPKTYFRYLMNVCVDHNSNQKLRPTHLLSLESEELLRECWKTWRLSWPFRVTMHLSSVKSSLSIDKIHLEETKETVKLLEKVLKDHPIGSWAEADCSFLKRVLVGLNNTLLHVLASQLSEYWEISNLVWIEDVTDLLDKVSNISTHLEVYLEKTKDLLQLEESIKATIKRWRDIEISSRSPDDISNLLKMADALNKEFDLIINQDIHKIMDTLTLPSIVMDVLLPYFALEMENWSLSADYKSCPLHLVFELYRRVLLLEHFFVKYGTKNSTSPLKFESWFLPHIKRWLKGVQESTLAWVQSALEQDDFSPTSASTSYSSSVTDLFSILDKSVQFAMDLNWPNYFQYCVVQIRLSKVVSEAIESYCKTMEHLINLECDTQALEELEIPPGSLFNLSKYLGKKAPKESVPTSVRPEVCVKLNDIEAVRSKLEKLYQSMEGDKMAEYLRTNMDDKWQSPGKDCSYFTEVLCSDTLQPMSRSGMSNPYVVFEVKNKRIFNTRTVYQSLNPRWNQEMTIKTAEKSLDVLAIVYSEDMVGADEECGSVWFKLSEELFGDCQEHEVRLPLSPQGTLTLRICLEGEKNDIQFWYGKSFRTLKRTENDVAKHIVSRMTSYIHSCLSRQTINKLLCRNTSLFYSLTAIKNTKSPTIHECEDGISSLIDFLEENLNVLYNNLSETVMHLVIIKIWKEILIALDNILLPPLSAQASDMAPLDIYELDVAFKWIELLKVLFNGGEDGDAIPLEELECSEYYSLLSLNVIYHANTEHLIQLCQAASQETDSVVSLKTEESSEKKTSRTKSVYYSKSTIRSSYRKPKKEKNRVVLPTESVLRLLRMRHEKSAVDYLLHEYEKRNNSSLHQRNRIVLL
ncbi:hypothetical protein CU098_013112 [Rhizopus stolonifer]|uniref:C2 domain-containing protein n=1 Tax=Rhizopus stolonifer TaxID=4846 RepID=A0A367KX03_RHIST|nr:hypothetical protein CU098_013112 [Rhizopus stolonifer]